MKTLSQIVAGGGWKGMRLDRIKVRAWIALILGMAFGAVSIFSIGSVLFYACIPAAISLTVSVVLFIREHPIEVESLAGRVGADPRKLYGKFGGCDLTMTRQDAEHAGSSDGDKPSEHLRPTYPSGRPTIRQPTEAPIELPEGRASVTITDR